MILYIILRKCLEKIQFWTKNPELYLNMVNVLLLIDSFTMVIIMTFVLLCYENNLSCFSIHFSINFWCIFICLHIEVYCIFIYLLFYDMF